MLSAPSVRITVCHLLASSSSWACPDQPCVAVLRSQTRHVAKLTDVGIPVTVTQKRAVGLRFIYLIIKKGKRCSLTVIPLQPHVSACLQERLRLFYVKLGSETGPADGASRLFLQLFFGCSGNRGRCFRTPCPIVVRSRPQCQRQRPDPAKRLKKGRFGVAILDRPLGRSAP